MEHAEEGVVLTIFLAHTDPFHDRPRPVFHHTLGHGLSDEERSMIKVQARIIVLHCVVEERLWTKDARSVHQMINVWRLFDLPCRSTFVGCWLCHT